jgi:hypothetical protein
VRLVRIRSQRYESSKTDVEHHARSRANEGKEVTQAIFGLPFSAILKTSNAIEIERPIQSPSRQSAADWAVDVLTTHPNRHQWIDPKIEIYETIETLRETVTVPRPEIPVRPELKEFGT